MSIYLRGKVWWFEFQAHGIRRQISTRCRDRKKAREFARRIRTAREMPTLEEAVGVLRLMYGADARAGGIPLADAWTTYEEVARTTGRDGAAGATKARRRNQVARLVGWIRRERPDVATVEGVTGPVAAAYAAWLVKGGAKTKTRINALGELSTVWRTLASASPDLRNPWPALRPPDTDGKVGRAFTLGDEAKVLEAARRVGKQWYEVCSVMRHTGLRYGDVATLRWADVDADAIRIKPRKTARRGISVAVPLIAALRDLIARIPRTDVYVFPVHAGLYGNRGRAARDALAFREVLEAAGLEGAGYTVHSWRHTAATRLAAHGVDVETRKALLGHRVDSTAERYDHDEHLAAKLAALEAAAT